MTEAIAPPRAARPSEACRLVCDAVSDGDLDAALVHYEPGAVILTHTTVRGRDQIRGLLAAAAAASRRLFTVAVRRTVLADDIALVIGDWTSHGSGPDGRPGISGGRYRSVVRLDAASYWRIAVEHLTADPSAEASHLLEQIR